MEYDSIQSIDPYDYEEYVAEYLREQGYRKVTTTSKSGDYGADVLAVAPNGVRVCIQCKRFVGSVGVKAVQEIYAAKQHYNCDLACVFTTGEYTHAAHQLAESTGVKLYHYVPDYHNQLPRRSRELKKGSNKLFSVNQGRRRQTSKKKNGGCLGTFIALAIILGIISKITTCLSPSSQEVSTYAERSNQPWTTVVLEDFEYKYENDGIVLQKYKGSAASIIIPSHYEVENTNLPVVKLDGSFEKNKSIINIAVSEGIQKISYDTFRGCSGIERLFIPSTIDYIGSMLQNIDNKGEILYYGGSEEQWSKIQRPTRSQISFKTVKVHVAIDECIENKDTIIDVMEHTQKGFTPLSEFSYDTRNGAIILGKYKGSSQTVRIQASYYVDGKEQLVIELDGTFNSNSSASIVIIPEGVKTLTAATFNGCKASKIYLPESLEQVPPKFWSYFHGTDSVYYGGTEEQFSKLIQMSRWDIDIKHVLYDARPEDLV